VRKRQGCVYLKAKGRTPRALTGLVILAAVTFFPVHAIWAAACPAGATCPADLNALATQGKQAITGAIGQLNTATGQLQGTVGAATNQLNAVTGQITNIQGQVQGTVQGLQNQAMGAVSGAVTGAIGDLTGSIPNVPAIPGLSNIVPGLTSGLPGDLANSIPGLSNIPGLPSLPGLPAMPSFGPPFKGCIASPGICQTNTATKTWWGTQPPFSPKMQSFLLNDLYTNLIVLDFWNQKFKPSLQQMTAQLSSLDVAQTGVMGTMIDGVVSNTAILGGQRLAANAYKNYTPGETLCRFGTMTRSLATADQRQDLAAVALSDIALGRQLGTKGTAAGPGPLTDRAARIDQFTRLYCNPGDNDGKLGPICGNGSPASTPARMNKDIAIGRTVLGQNTLDVDFTNTSLTADEEDVLALSSNLYGHDVLQRLTEIMTSDKSGNANNKLDYMTLRQLMAFRNIAQASFNQAVARRARGGAGSAYFMANILREMGMSDVEAARVLDKNTGAPSYHAQMEILTKKIYENPNFYTNLIDKPANVDRQQAAMQAFGLMQDRDITGAFTRQELLMAMMLELKLRREQRDVERNLKSVGQVK
jgi:hypothetical protein